MESRRHKRVIAPQEWLTRIEEAGQHAIHRAFRRAGPAGQKVKNTLHGTWLGHPLQAALTDVPVGARTASMVFGTTRGREFRIAADGRMTLGRNLSALGYAVATVAARLGVRAEHTASRNLPVDVSPVQGESGFPEGGLRRVEHKGTPILLTKRYRRILPLAETRSHLADFWLRATSWMIALNAPGTVHVLHLRMGECWMAPRFTLSPAWRYGGGMDRLKSRARRSGGRPR